MFGTPEEEVGGCADGVWARVWEERILKSSEVMERRARFSKAIALCLFLLLLVRRLGLLYGLMCVQIAMRLE